MVSAGVVNIHRYGLSALENYPKKMRRFPYGHN
jgi:hypothetical protein